MYGASPKSGQNLEHLFYTGGTLRTRRTEWWSTKPEHHPEFNDNLRQRVRQRVTCPNGHGRRFLDGWMVSMLKMYAFATILSSWLVFTVAQFVHNNKSTFTNQTSWANFDIYQTGTRKACTPWRVEFRRVTLLFMSHHFKKKYNNFLARYHTNPNPMYGIFTYI